ncbi:MAG: hypothetical protein NTY96_12040 [Bacteroidetes bacterium]|nr:hypothetical protein [Bacteroidota bacterium]
MKRILIYTIIIILGIPSVAVLGLLVFLQLTEYRPPPIEFVPTTGKAKPLASDKTEFSFLTWNIGYAGLGREMDYFYEGGKKVRPGRQDMDKYIKGICSELKSTDSVDFVFLQEIDKDAKRTYELDQLEEINKVMPDYCSIFAMNYYVRFIPAPISEPIGKVKAGLITFSRFMPENNERHAYDASFSWPKKLVWLKRCFLSSSYTVFGDKQMILVNLHNSAYDSSGELRRRELEILQTYVQREYQKGNYIIIGGDWNMNPKGFNRQGIRSGDKVYSIQNSMDKTFMPGWKTVYDTLLPTNRNVDAPYQKGKTGTTAIDFFLISPNVEVLKCVTADKGFVNSDHNPVYAKFRLQAPVSGSSQF